MGNDFSKNFFVNSIVSELFTVESQLCSTRTADLFKAFDRERGRPVAVWMLRAQFETDSPIIVQFTNRLGKLSLQNSSVAKVLTAGVDPTGVVFSVIPPIDGYPITGGNLDAVEAERRFIAICRIVEQLHLSGIICGDLGSCSFWVSRSGDVQFVGIMGSFEEEGSNAPVPPLDTLAYVAPEQNPSGALNPYHDVYALGVLGYQLFTKKIPFENPGLKGSEKPAAPRSIAPSAPLWIDEILLKCLEPIPSRRFATAGMLIAGLLEAKERIAVERSAVTERQSRALTEKDKNDGSVVTFQPGGSGKESTESGEMEAGISTKRLAVIGAGLAVLMAFLLVGGFLVFKKASTAVVQDDQQLSTHREAADDRMRQAIDVVNDTDSALNEKRIKFQELQQSDDPLAHDILVRSAVDGENPKIRMLAEQAIVSRAKRLGFELAGSAVGAWLQTTSVQSPPPEYEFVLKSLNVSIPVEGRKEALRRVFELNPELAMNVLTGLVLTGSNGNEYKDLAAEFIGATEKLDLPKDVSAAAVLMIHEPLYNEYRTSLIEHIRSGSPRDLMWLLETVVNKNGPQISAVTSAVMDRKIFGPIKMWYLKPLRDSEQLPDGMQVVLLRGATGQLSRGDIESIGMWLDQTAEEVLLAICADELPEDLQTEAVEYLAGRGLHDQPQASFIDWIKRNAWDQRGVLAEPLGVAALSSDCTVEKMRHALAKIEGFTKSGGLFSILFQAVDPRFIKLVLEMYRTVIPSKALITLLAHHSKEVRIAAVNSIKDVNEVGALNTIIELYNAEVDPEVRKAYSDNLWVIKERVEGKK